MVPATAFPGPDLAVAGSDLPPAQYFARSPARFLSNIGSSDRFADFQERRISHPRSLSWRVERR
jgi:hypothetical protein